MYAGIDAARAGSPVSAVGHAIADVADRHRFGLVRAFTGHGIGQVFHAAPFVKHFRNDDTMELVPGARLGALPERHQPSAPTSVRYAGMTLTVEPMLVEGTAKVRRRSSSAPDLEQLTQLSRPSLGCTHAVALVAGQMDGRHCGRRPLRAV